MRIFTHYDRPGRVMLEEWGRSHTRQADKEASDINNIMRKYETTGILPVENRQAFYADVSQLGDYREAIGQVRMADEHFSQLPADVRRKFDNDPALFLDFCSDPENQDAMRDLGLLEKISVRDDVKTDVSKGVETDEADPK